MRTRGVVVAIALVLHLCIAAPAAATDPPVDAVRPSIEHMARGADRPPPPILADENAADLVTVGAGFPGLSRTTSPSDGAIAAGPNHLLQAVNSAMAIYSKTGVLYQQQELTSLFGLPSSARVMDPRVHYDSTSQRWFLLAFHHDSAVALNRFYFAISRGADPTAGFCYFSKDQSVVNGVSGMAEADFPGLGMDDYALYITMVRFSMSTDAVVDTAIEMFPRNSLDCASGGLSPFVWRVNKTFPDGRRAHVVQPALAFGLLPEAYFVTTSWDGGSYVGVWTIDHSTEPFLRHRTMPVQPYVEPGFARQKGSAVPLDFGDTRMSSSPIVRSGVLYFAHTANTIWNTSGTRWYKVALSTLGILDQGTIQNSAFAVGFPTPMVDSHGGMAILAAITGADYYPSLAVWSRSAGDPAGSLSLGEVVADGLGPYELRGTRMYARWGDYFGIALDTDGKRIWTAGTYARAFNSWGTVITPVTASTPPPVQPARYVVALSDAAPAAGATITVTAQLVTADGTPVAIAGRTVAWSSTGGGMFSASSSATDGTGRASIQFKTAPGAATHTVTATDNLGMSGTSQPFTSRVVATVYLPNITRTLGGPNGWQTPFIAQNVGTVAATLSVKYYSFTSGALMATKTATVQPGRSYVGSPNHEPELPDNSQFSVVISSTGAPVVAVVNEHQGQGAASEALSYSGFSSGSTKVHLPLVSKMVGGWLTTMVIQNLGTSATAVSAAFTRIGAPGSVTLNRVVQPGRSQFIDPRSEASLVNGAEYSVTLTSPEPIGVVANAHNDLPGTVMPMGDSYNGVPAVTGTTTYLPYVAKNTDGIGRTTRVVIQNAGTLAAVPVLSLVGFNATTPATITVPSIEPGASYAFTPVAADGEYSITITGGTFAALATTISPATAMFNTGTSTTASKLFMPNVTRALSGGAGDPGWTTPILIQSADATTATLSWYSFSGGLLVATQTVALVPGATTRVNPVLVAGLSNNAQYAVVLNSPGQVVAIVTELNLSGGDNAMVYKAFPTP